MNKIYLIERIGECSYDEFDSGVVVATSEEEARTVELGTVREDGSWVSPDKVTATYMGEAKKGLKNKAIICASFNAG